MSRQRPRPGPSPSGPAATEGFFHRIFPVRASRNGWASMLKPASEVRARVVEALLYVEDFEAGSLGVEV